MRKRMKEKKRACGLCKPHKRKLANRWKPKEEARLKETEALIRRTVADSEEILKALE